MKVKVNGNKLIASGYDVNNIFQDYTFENFMGFETGFIDDNEPLIDIIENIKVEIFKCPKECTLEEAQARIFEKYFGDFSIETQDYGWSEYTIEGYEVYSATIGGHNLLDILNNIKGFVIITFEKIK